MASTPISKELKNAISEMPIKEKDKLLFRLIAKDQKLVDKLEFQLLEKGESIEERRERLEQHIKNEMNTYPKRFYSPGYLMMHLREISGRINHHKLITKDKYGEIYLNYQMLNLALKNNKTQLQQSSYYKMGKFNNYVVKRTLKLYRLLAKLHEDYVIEFEDDLKELGHHIGSIDSMMHTAIHQGLDVNWLIQGILPDYEI